MNEWKERSLCFLVITYRQGTDERASRALDILQSSFRCCGYDGRLSFQNNVPLSCNMFSIGCLPRTMFFLDSCMDALAAVLLFFSILKLLIVMFFYSFLCVYQHNRRKHQDNDPHSMNNSSDWRHSSSFDASSSDNLPKKILISTPVKRQDDIAHDQFIEKRRIILNDYDAQTPNKRVQGAAALLPLSSSTSPASSASSKSLTTMTSHEHNTLRKLSSISEKTERTETDESEPDLRRIKSSNAKRPAIVTSAQQKRSPPPLPNKLPIIKHRRKIARDDENDNDSGKNLCSGKTTWSFLFVTRCWTFVVWEVFRRSFNQQTTGPDSNENQIRSYADLLQCLRHVCFSNWYQRILASRWYQEALDCVVVDIVFYLRSLTVDGDRHPEADLEKITSTTFTIEWSRSDSPELSWTKETFFIGSEQTSRQTDSTVWTQPFKQIVRACEQKSESNAETSTTTELETIIHRQAGRKSCLNFSSLL